MHEQNRTFVPGARKALILICLGIICAMTPWFSATAILPELRASWQMSPMVSAFMTGAVQVGFVIGALGMAITSLADIVSSVRLMVTGALLAGLCTAVVGMVDTAHLAIVLRLLTGMALAMVYPPAMKLATTWFIRGRGLALGLVIGGLTIGSALPHLLRAGGTGLDWRMVMTGAALIAGLGAILFARLHEGPHAHARARFDPRQLGQVLRDRPVMLTNIGYFGHMWELYAMWTWLLAWMQTALMAQEGVMDRQLASLIVFVVVASGVGGAILGGILADRLGRARTVIGMMALSALSAGLMGIVHDGPMWLLLPVAILWGITVIGDSAQFSAMLAERARGELVGTALSLQMALGFMITLVSIQLLPWLADLIGGWRWVFMLLVPGPVIGIIAILRLQRLERRI